MKLTCPMLYDIIRKRDKEISSGLWSSSSFLSDIAFPKLDAMVDADRPIYGNRLTLSFQRLRKITSHANIMRKQRRNQPITHLTNGLAIPTSIETKNTIQD